MTWSLDFTKQLHENKKKHLESVHCQPKPQWWGGDRDNSARSAGNRVGMGNKMVGTGTGHAGRKGGGKTWLAGWGGVGDDFHPLAGIVQNGGGDNRIEVVKNALSQQRLEQPSRNMAWWCWKGVCRWKFDLSKNVGRQAGMLKPVKLQNSTIFEPLDNLGEI